MGVCCCSMAGTNACQNCGSNLIKATGIESEPRLLYYRLASIAYDAVLDTMREGERTHPDNKWNSKTETEHIIHALEHLVKVGMEDKSEDHSAHAITRCAMIRYLEENK